MQDQAAIGSHQLFRCAAIFWILIGFDIKFWTCKEAKNICSTFGDTKQSYASSRNSVTDPCVTLWAGSKNAIYLDIDRRPYLIPYSSMCDWSTPRVWPLFLSMTFPSPPTKTICMCELFSSGQLLRCAARFWIWNEFDLQFWTCKKAKYLFRRKWI